MENINIKKIGFIILMVLFFCSCNEKKTEIFKMNIDLSRLAHERAESQYFIVSNPPSDFAGILLFYQRELTRFSLEKNKDFLTKEEFYFQSYYRERFFFDRNYKEPKPNYGKIISSDFFFDTRSVDVSHYDDKFIDIYFKENNLEDKDAPVPPYLYIHKMNLYYYPKGLKNNPDTHWKMSIGRPGDINYKTIRF